MMQVILTIAAFALALSYLVRFVYQSVFKKDSKCNGCAVSKLYEMKINSKVEGKRS